MYFKITTLHLSIFLDALAVKAIVPDKVQHDVSINHFTSNNV